VKNKMVKISKNYDANAIKGMFYVFEIMGKSISRIHQDLTL
jgi:hypothetical protein